MHYQISTTNLSFLKMYQLLKEKGVMNNKFFLMLFDKSLEGVDPHSPDLTKEQQVRVLKEITKNKWYYLREVIRIPVPGGSVPYELNRGNLALTWAMTMNLNIIMMLPRQNGKTIGVIADDTWTYHFGTENSNILYGNKEFKDSKNNLKRFKDITELLPPYIREYIEVKGDTDNESMIVSKRTNNTITALSAPRDPVSADKAARGNTTPKIYWDEFAFLKHNKTILGAAAPAQSKAQDMARKLGKPYGKVITTTPNDLNSEEGMFCKEMIDNGVDFMEEMYDWTPNEVRTFIRNNSLNDFIYIEFSYKQLGHDEEWLQKQKRDLFNDTRLLKREVLLEWLQSNESSPFEEDELDAILYHVKEPLNKLILNGKYRINIYDSIDPELNYIMGVDVAGGLSRDDSAITIIHPLTDKVVATFRNNKIDTVNLSELIVDLATRFYPNSVIVVERNSYGKAIIDMLRRTEVSPRLYFQYRKQSAQQKVNNGFNATSNTKIKEYGVNTDVNSRQQMVNELLFHIVANQPEVIVDKAIYEDIKGLKYTNTGKIEHSGATKDDGLFSYLVARYIKSYGTNTASFIKNIGSINMTKDEKINQRKSLSSIAHLNNDTYNEVVEQLNFLELNKKTKYNDEVIRAQDKQAVSVWNMFDSLNN